ncbi:MAG: nonstructural protein [Microvirus sp.]|nr:MAG: nonstructural protein [Microvirus sp.]
MTRLFTIYDLKAEFHSAPFTARNVGEGARMFAQAVNDPSTQIHKYPDDYVLYEIGAFDADTGMVSQGERVRIGAGTDYVNQQ